VFEDFRAYAHLPFHSDGYFSTDRWAVTGEAGAFTDPFYSPGSDFIATANELITSMIVAERSGDAKRFAEVTELANAFYKLKYEQSLAVYVHQYPTFGSFEIFRLKYLLDFHNYYNLIYWPFLADKLGDAAWLKEEIGFATSVVRTVSSFGEHFVKMGEELRARGEYFGANRGRFANGLDGVAQLEMRMGPALDGAYRKSQLDQVHAGIFAAIVERTLSVPGLAQRASVLGELSLPVTLALKQIDESCLSRLLQRVAARLTRDVRERFPSDGVERVTLEASPPGGAAAREVRVDVVGPSGEARERALAHARALWDQRGESLAAGGVGA
jgi:hypothetical protein